MNSIATYAKPMGARVCFSSCFKRIFDFGYTLSISSKKGLIGIGVPCNRCDASRSSPADHAASLFVPPVLVARMGGRKARRFAQAVPGTPTRSSCRPQLALGAAVVAKRTAWRPHMAQSIASHGTATLATSELIIEIIPRWITRFIGTSAQLIAEGLIPEGFKWPSRTQEVQWTTGKYRYAVCRCRPANVKGPKSGWAEGDYWMLDYDISNNPVNCFDYLVYKKSLELRELIACRTPATQEITSRCLTAKRDASYMAFRQQLGIVESRKPGRPRKTRANSSEIPS